MQRLLSALMGPVFAKEIVEITRRKRYFVNRVLYGAGLLCALLFVWEETGLRYTTIDAASLSHVLARMALALFATVSWVQFMAVFLFVPVFVCGVIAGEREENTLELLFTTDLHDREIVLGKLGSRLAVVALLMLSSLPVMSLIMLLGGVDPASIWRTQAATLLAMVYAGAHAIYFSAISKNTLGALVRTYWWMGLWMLALPTSALLILDGLRVAWPTTEHWLVAVAFVNPIGPFVVATEPRLHAQIANLAGDWFYPFTLLAPLLWSVFLLWRATRRLRLPPTSFAFLHRFAWVKTGIEVWKVVFDGLDEAAGGAIARIATGRRAPASTGEVANPLWQRSRVARVYDREGYLKRVQWGGWAVTLFFVVLLAMLSSRGFDDDTAMVFLSFVWGGVAVLAVIVSATSVVGDRRRGFLDLLLTTPLDPREVVDGTMLAVWQHLRLAYWLPCALYFLFAIVGHSPFIGIVCSCVSATLFFAVLVAMGTLCSLAARTTANALAVSFAFPVLMVIGILLPMAIEDVGGIVLWIVSALAWLVTREWSRRSTSVAAVGCHFMVVHLVLVCLATCWTYDGSSDAFPMLAMHPGAMTIAPLERSSYRELHTMWAATPFYWSALFVNFLWARRWMIRDFDRFVGRTHSDRRGRRWAAPHRLPVPIRVERSRGGKRVHAP